MKNGFYPLIIVFSFASCDFCVLCVYVFLFLKNVSSNQMSTIVILVDLLVALVRRTFCDVQIWRLIIV